MAESEGMSVSHLMEDLANITDWYSLGTQLGLESRQLDVIEQEIPAGVGVVERRKRRVLDIWMKGPGKTGEQSWMDVVSALMKMGEHSVAKEMRRQYSESMAVKPTVSVTVAIAKENQQQIKGEFIDLQMLVCEKLQTMQINMPRFLFFIKNLFLRADFLPASKKIDDIFEAITCNGLWDFINYTPLQQIAKKFIRHDEEVNTAIHKYRCALAGYLAGTKLADHIASMSPISEEALKDYKPPCARMDQSYFERLTFKLKAKVTEESLDYLIELWDKVSVYLGLPSLTYLLDEIREGCVSATWLVPPSIMPVIDLKIDDPETAKFLSKLGIIQIEVDDLCLYEEQEQNVGTATVQDSSLEQFPDSQEQVEKEASPDIVKETAEQEQDSSSEELHQHKEGGGWREQSEALQNTVSIERKIRKRTEEENGELRAAIASKEVEIGQLREKITGLECMLNQTQEELRELKEESVKLREQMETKYMKRGLSVSQEELQQKAISKVGSVGKSICSVAVGRGLQYGETNQIAEFQVHLTNANGEPCVERQEVKVELQSLVDGCITQAKVSHQTRSMGSYSVSYQPSIRGRHELSVLVNGEAITDSAFILYVQQPPQLMGYPVRVIKGLSRPQSATLSSNGQLIVTELGGRILEFDHQGELVHRIDSVELQHSRVQLYPNGVAIDDIRMMYVCDGNAHKLFKVSSTGKVLKSVGGEGSGSRQFDWPGSIALRDNRLYICDYNNHRIQIFSCDLNFISCLGCYGSGEGEFICPRDIAFDQEGNMYVVDSGNHRVQVFSSSGTFLRTFGKYGSGSGELNGPMGIHVDHNIVYITDDHCISTFSTLGLFITSFGRRGNEKGEFSWPRGITMDYDGFLYVCDHFNDRIQVF